VNLDALPESALPLQTGKFKPTGTGFGPDIRSLTGKETPEEKREALRRAAKEFEAIFIYQMIAAMRKTVGHGGLVRKGAGEKIFESMLDEEWAKKLASKGGPNSLSEMLYRQLSRHMGLEEEEEAAPTRDGDGFMSLPPSASTTLIKLRRTGAAEENGHE